MSWQVDLMRVDLVKIYLMRIDFVKGSQLVNVLPVAVPGEVVKRTEIGCVVEASFTIRNLTRAPSVSLTVYTMGSNCTATAVKVQEQHTVLVINREGSGNTARHQTS